MSSLVLVALTLIPAAGPARVDDDKLQGTWNVVSALRDGEDFEAPKGDKLVFDQGKITIEKKDGTKNEGGTYTADPAKTPKELDVKPPNQETVLKAIYQIDGDDMKLCLGRPDSDRPTELASKAGSNVMLIVLRREKP